MAKRKKQKRSEFLMELLDWEEPEPDYTVINRQEQLRSELLNELFGLHKTDYTKVRRILDSFDRSFLADWEALFDKGSNVLQNLFAGKAPVSLIEEVIAICPSVVEDKDKYFGQYPIHVACQTKQYESIIQLLVTKYPKALEVADKHGCYPLHYACSCDGGMSESVFQLLYSKYEAVINKLDNKGRNPLHLLCQNGGSSTEYIIRSIINHVNRILKKQKDSDGCYPIHYAYKSKLSDTVIGLLTSIDSIPEDQTDDFSVQYPLHNACKRNDLQSIELLVQQYPIAVQQQCTNGMYPLHYACQQSSDNSVIQFLMTEYPMAITHQCTVHGYTPLHWICVNTSISFNTLVIENESFHTYFRIAATTQQHGKCTPLHLACKYNQPLPVIEYLLSNYRSALTMPDANGYCPLHTACENGQSHDVYNHLAWYDPTVELHAAKDGWFPLHIACAYGQSFPVIKSIVSEYPSVLLKQTSDGLNPLQLAMEAQASAEIIQFLQRETWNVTLFPPRERHRYKFVSEYPLHDACRNNDSELYIQQVIRQHPTAVQHICMYGMYPLHYACRYSEYESVIQLLYDTYPKAFEEPCTYYGYYPLHWLCTNKELVVDSLIQSMSLHDSFRTVCLAQTHGGCTPLHLACQNKKSLQVVECLFRYGGEAIHKKNINDCLPLHIACKSGQSEDVIEFLIRLYRGAVREVSKEGWLPLHFACANDQSEGVVKLLVAEYPSALWHCTSEGKQPLQLAEEAQASQEIISFLQNQASITIFSQLMTSNIIM